jgi:hypothetical protein
VFSVAGRNTVVSVGVGLGWAVGDICSARGDGDVLVASVGHLVWALNRAAIRSIVHWSWSWSCLVLWLISAGGGVAVWNWLSTRASIVWIVGTAGENRAENGSGSSEGSEMHFVLYYYLIGRSVKEY